MSSQAEKQFEILPSLKRAFNLVKHCFTIEIDISHFLTDDSKILSSSSIISCTLFVLNTFCESDVASLFGENPNVGQHLNLTHLVLGANSVYFGISRIKKVADDAKCVELDYFSQRDPHYSSF